MGLRTWHCGIGLTTITLLLGPCFAHPGHDEPVLLAADVSAGADEAAKPSVKIEVRDGFRYVTSNGVPDHPAGRFPNRNNPNSIQPQRYEFRLPLQPKVNEIPSEVQGGLFGVALNGIVLDPGTAEWWQNDPSLGWRMEAIGGPRNLGLDQNNAHVQPNGAYHYHAAPTGLIEKIAGKEPTQPVQIGWAADGFPIYGPMGYSDAKDPKSKLKALRSSYFLRLGERPAQPDAPGGKPDGAYTRDWEFIRDTGDLDECNGRTGVMPEFPDGTYYYVISNEWPFVPRLLRGTPDASFLRRRTPGGPGGRGGSGGFGPPSGSPPAP